MMLKDSSKDTEQNLLNALLSEKTTIRQADNKTLSFTGYASAFSKECRE